MDNADNKGMENIEKFVEQMIDEQNYETLDAVTKETLKADMVQKLLDQIDRAAIEALPEEKAIELSEKLDQGEMSDEEVQEFMVNSGVDLQKVALVTMLQFKMLYQGGVENE